MTTGARRWLYASPPTPARSSRRDASKTQVAATLYRDNCCTTRFSHVHRNSVEQPIENACDAPCASNASAKSSQLSVFCLRGGAAFICNCWMSVFDRRRRSWSKSGPVFSQNVVREAKNAARGVRMRAQFERCRYRSMRLRRDIATTFDTRTTCVRSGWSVRTTRRDRCVWAEQMSSLRFAKEGAFAVVLLCRCVC